MPIKKIARRFSITPGMTALTLAMVLFSAIPPLTQQPAPAPSSDFHPADAPPPDPKIAAALKEISAAHIQANIEKLVSFGTRSTLSAQDPASIAAGRGIGAAREWIKAEFERYSKDCGGCLEVKTDSFTKDTADRVPKATQIANVYAVLKGSDPEA